MKLPTLTAITLATAVLAAGPALAANPPPANAAGTATVAPANTDHHNLNAAATPSANQPAGANANGTVTVATRPPGAKSSQVAAEQQAVTPGAAATTTIETPGINLTNNPIGTAHVAGANNANNGNNKNANPNTLPHQRNPVLADNGLPRAGKVIGSDVYNASDKKLGSIDDILMGVNGQPDQAVIDVANANKKVLVPFKDLVFGNTQISGDNKVILGKQTPDSLAQATAFNYDCNDANNCPNLATANPAAAPTATAGSPTPAAHQPMQTTATGANTPPPR